MRYLLRSEHNDFYDGIYLNIEDLAAALYNYQVFKEKFNSSDFERWEEWRQNKTVELKKELKNKEIYYYNSGRIYCINDS